MGWTDYIVTDQGPSLPKSTPQHQQETLRSLSAVAARAKELVAGAKSLTEWIDSGEPAVPEEKATHRAIICSKCPLNQEGDWTRWFTVPASELIKRQVKKAQDRKLTTPRDDQINICVACHCPLKLKVHVPIPWIAKRLTDEQKAKLAGGKDCWIIQEIALS
jgi:cytochrome c553